MGAVEHGWEQGNELRRWALGRRFELDPGWENTLVWIMLNPSTADDDHDDPTMRRVSGFTRSLGYTSCVVVNLYSLRTPDPDKLFTSGVAPNDPRNDEAIRTAATMGPVMAAWGARAPRSRVDWVLDWLIPDVRLRCLGRTKTGAPRHPLYVPASRRPVTFRRGRA